MNPLNKNPQELTENRALNVLLLLVSVGFLAVLLPFWGTIMWGIIIAMSFKPMYLRFLPKFKQNHNRAAIATLLIVLLIVILPLGVITGILTKQIANIVLQFQNGSINLGTYLHQVFDALPSVVTGFLKHLGLDDFNAFQAKVVSLLAQGSQAIASQTISIGQNTFDFAMNVCVSLYLAFFLIRDGDPVKLAIRRALPLNGLHKKELAQKFNTVIRATVRGNLIVAMVQGALGGIAFWFLGISAALVWAVFMSFASLLPAIGAALVWIPVAIYLFAVGQVWQAVALTLFGIFVIGLIDNLLRPQLVGRDTGMPDYLVLITTLGGIGLFGINGFVIGPAIAAMFIAAWHIHIQKNIAIFGDVEPIINQ